MIVAGEMVRVVRARADGRCQYCLMHESLQGATFHIQHIIPRSKGGRSALENLALACPSCNLQKGARIDAKDPVTGSQVSLFHPTWQFWSEHFQLDGFKIEGLTDAGRAPVEALNFNPLGRQRIREVEQTFGLFPPWY